MALVKPHGLARRMIPRQQVVIKNAIDVMFPETARLVVSHSIGGLFRPGQEEEEPQEGGPHLNLSNV